MFGWQASYVRARSYEKQNNWAAAVRVYERLVRHGETDNARVRFRLGHALFRLEQLSSAIPHLEHAVALAPNEADWIYRLAFVYERLGSLSQAIKRYEDAMALSPGNEKWEIRRRKCVSAFEQQSRGLAQEPYRRMLKDVIDRKGASWEKLDVLEAGYEAHRTDRNWLLQLGKARFDMNKFEEAANAYSQALAIGPEDANSYFMMGWSWERCGRLVIAEKYYNRAIQMDKRLDAASLGIGVFFQGKGEWRLASEAYKRVLTERPDNAELCYRVGFALQKIYAWSEAERYLTRAIVVGPAQPGWHYRRGLSFERLGEYSRAAECYREATEASSKVNRYWFYRLGWSHAKCGNFIEACEAYESSLQLEAIDNPKEFDGRVQPSGSTEMLSQALLDALDSQSAELCSIVGRRAEEYGELSIAREALEAAVARAEDYEPSLYYRLGRVLSKQREWEQGAAVYAKVRIFGRPFGVDVAPYLKSPAVKKSMTYAEYTETLEIAEETVLYESSHGASVSCNPLAIFRKLISDARFEGYTHIWVLNDKRRVPWELRNRRDVVLVSRESDLYLRYLASSRYLINNNTFPPYFVRRDGQEYLNTWHGTPIKTLGRDIKSGVMDHKNAARNFLHATHMIFPNAFTAETLVKKYDIESLYSGRLAVTGYPRNDSTTSMTESSRTRLRKSLGIPSGHKVVLYAPTWRGTLAHKSLDTSKLADDLESLGGGEWHFLFRGHSVHDGVAVGSIADRFAVPADVDTNDLLAIVDVLITDYSSIMFDFMATGRPIVYYAYDIEEYVLERGLYFDLDKMGGSVCETIDETIAAVEAALKVGSEENPYLTTSLLHLHQLEVGESTNRVVEFFFFGASEFSMLTPSNERPNVLFFAGSFIPNGVTSAFLNLTHHLDPMDYNLHVVLEPAAVLGDQARKSKLASLPDFVRAIGRVGSHLVTPEERWVIDKFNIQNRLDSVEMWDLYSAAHRREFLRIFGQSNFDAIVCFEGYARFWASVLANPVARPQFSSIYLHSVMMQERNNRFPYLDGIFQIYREYNRLISVSESAALENAQDLREVIDNASDKFCSVTNLLNPNEALDGANSDLDSDLIGWFDPEVTTFVAVGRLSPEKGHLKLIRAFSMVHAVKPEARLIIVGDGPMRDKLDKLIRDLGAGEYILMAGMRSNPYVIVQNADCFVFSSDYEGQGIAVLEALVLGKPVISTNVTGPKSILEDGYGLLVDNSSEGLMEGMVRFLNSELHFKSFDHEMYQKQSVVAFEKFALELGT